MTQNILFSLYLGILHKNDQVHVGDYMYTSKEGSYEEASTPKRSSIGHPTPQPPLYMSSDSPSRRTAYIAYMVKVMHAAKDEFTLVLVQVSLKLAINYIVLL
jgi:hypothetical protein